MEVKRYYFEGLSIQVFDPPQPDPNGRKMVEMPLTSCVPYIDDQGRDNRRPIQIGVTYSFAEFSVTRYAQV